MPRAWLPIQAEHDIQRRQDNYARLLQDVSRTMTVDEARAIADWAVANPYASPRSTVPLAMAGITPSSAAGRMILRQNPTGGATRSDPITLRNVRRQEFIAEKMAAEQKVRQEVFLALDEAKGDDEALGKMKDTLTDTQWDWLSRLGKAWKKELDNDEISDDVYERTFGVTRDQARYLLPRLPDVDPEPGGWRGWIHNAGDMLTTGTRYGMAGLQAGMEGAQAGFRDLVASSGRPSTDVGANITRTMAPTDREFDVPRPPLPNFLKLATAAPGQITRPEELGGVTGGGTTTVRTGNVRELLDPRQITLYNMIAEDQPSGAGIFVDLNSPAAQMQAEAARRAGAIQYADGTWHALTPGRLGAAAVAEAGSKEYDTLSGLLDAAVAWEVDPANTALGVWQDAKKAKSTVDVFKLNDTLGVVNGKRRFLQPWSVDNYLASDAWSNTARKMLESGDFTEINLRTSYKLDPRDIGRIVDISRERGVTDDAVREVTGLMRRSFDEARLTNTLGWDHWVANKFDNARWTHLMPHGAIPTDPNDPAQLRIAINQSDRLAMTVKATRAERSEIANRLAHAEDEIDVYKAVLGRAPGESGVADPGSLADVLARHVGERTILGVGTGKRIDELIAAGNSFPKARSQAAREAIMASKRYKQEVARNVARGYTQEGAEEAALKRVSATVEQANDTTNMLSRFFHGRTESDRARWAATQDEWGLGAGTIFMPDPNDARRLDSVDVTHQPHLLSELISQPISMPDARALRQAVSWLTPAFELPGIGNAIKGSTSVLDFVTQRIWKPAVLLRLAWPVRVIAEEQLRMGAAGYDSMFAHPLSYITRMVGRGKNDALGDDFADEFAKTVEHWNDSAYQRTVRTPPSGKFHAERLASKHMRTFSRNDKGYVNAVVEQIQKLMSDELASRTAQALRKGKLDELKDDFWQGHYTWIREKLAKANAWGGKSARLMDERAVADAYIDSVATRVQHFAGGLKGEADDDILKVIAEGHKVGGKSTSGDLIEDVLKRAGKKDPKDVEEVLDVVDVENLLESLPDHVKVLTAEGVMPDQVVGTFLDERRAGWYDDAVDFMFSHLMGKPTAYLSRSPTFTQAYWKHWEQIAGGLSPDDAKILLANARKAKLSNAQIRRLSQTAAAGEHAGKIALKDGDLLAKGFALDETKKLLYDAAERNQFFDSMRIAFPFGDAWKEVITRWATLTRENPRIPRRFQQLIQGARGAGIFSKDPQDGREYFIVPGSEQITKRISGMPFPMRASVSGLNIVGQGVPGLGPALAMPLSTTIPDNETTSWVNDLLFPYGRPQTGLLEAQTYYPAWFKRLADAGLLEDIPGLGTLVQPTPEGARIFENSIKDAVTYLASTGKYNLEDRNSLSKLLADAKDKARGLALARAFIQSWSPSAPQPVYKVQNKDGQLQDMEAMMRYAYQLREQFPDDWEMMFLDEFGGNLRYLLEPRGQRVVYGAPTTDEARWWGNDHPRFMEKYPNTYGYWAPRGGEFSYDAYLRALERGEIQPLGAKEWMDLANDRVASALYAQARRTEGPHPNRDQQNNLGDYREWLKDKFPGYQPSRPPPSGMNTDDLIEEIFKAANDQSEPDTYDTDVGKALRYYESKRAAALQVIKDAGWGKSLGVSQATAQREWLREIGYTLSAQVPGFYAAWDGLLEYEVLEEDQL